jgi:hypothetical protein
MFKIVIELHDFGVLRGFIHCVYFQGIFPMLIVLISIQIAIILPQDLGKLLFCFYFLTIGEVISLSDFGMFNLEIVFAYTLVIKGISILWRFLLMEEFLFLLEKIKRLFFGI